MKYSRNNTSLLGREKVDSKFEAHDPAQSRKLIRELRLYQIDLKSQIEELLRTQQELRDSVNHYAQFFNQAPIGYVVVDRHGNILETNKTFSEMLGMQISEIVDCPLKSFIHSKDRKVLSTRFKTLYNQSDKKLITFRLKRKNGTYLHASLEGRTIAKSLLHTQDPRENRSVLLLTVSDICELKRLEQRMRRYAFHDPLTNLPNRAMILRRLAQTFSAAKRFKKQSAILFIDLDNFKTINDSLGHPIGDLLLQNIAKLLTKVIRREDTVGRVGGDEFVIILFDYADNADTIANNAYTVAVKIKEALSQPNYIGEHELHITPSIGIALFPDKEEDANGVLKRADTAMYHAKAMGRNLINFYEPSMQVAANHRIAMENNLRRALQADEFLLYFQPQFDEKHRIVGAETLLRWKHPKKGLIPPNSFISLAEETGLILPIGQWVLRSAAAQLKQWEDRGLCAQDGFLAINVSPRQFRHIEFIEQLINISTHSGIPLTRLKLEITEGLMVGEGNDDISIIKALNELGLRLSIDDFGTGYSCLAYLKRMPVSEIKIDKSFVRDIVSDSNDATIVETIILMANHLGLRVIAEGVEDKAGIDFLRSRGCNTYQGYYFSRPIPAREFTILLENEAKGRNRT